MIESALLYLSGLVIAFESNERGLDVTCGSQCLYISLKALDFDVPPVDELEERLGPPTPEGYSLAQIADVAQTLGAHTLGVQSNVANLERRPGRFACIAKWANGHFVILGGVDEHRRMLVIDPPRSFSAPVDVISSQWDGTALLVSPAPLLAEEELPRPGAFGRLVIAFAVCGALILACSCGIRLVNGRSAGFRSP